MALVRAGRRACGAAALALAGACGVLGAGPALAGSTPAAEPAPAQIKVVVVTMFEHGEPTGDRPGELQLWVERLPLSRRSEFPLGEYPLFSNDDGVLAVCVGGGIANATASIMALGLDPRFDLTRSYWLVAGIAGGDPQDVSLGSAVWARHVVDGDLLYEIDAREIPPDWPYGIVPLGGKAPAETPQDIYTGWTVDTIHFALDPGLADWAYDISREATTADTPAMQQFRAAYGDRTNARRPPFVTLGDTLSASTYWHGARLNGWANDWVRLYAGDGAEFMTSNMEDSGTLTALHRLGRIGRADVRRIMVLRTVSNFTEPPPGRSAAWSTTAAYPDQGYPALDAAQRAGGVVVEHLVTHWDRVRERIPGHAPADDPGISAVAGGAP